MVKNATIVFLVILVVLLLYQVNALAPSVGESMYTTPSSETSSDTGTKATAPVMQKAAPQPVTRAQDGTYLVSYTNSGFSPKYIEIPRGSTVRWTNNSSKAMRIKTLDLIDRQPTNKMNQSVSVAKGASYSFTFNDPYIYGYTNENNTKDTGTIAVNP